MSAPTSALDAAAAWQLVEAAVAAGKITPSAAEHIRTWLTAPRYAEYAPQVVEHVAAGKWKTLDDVFWTVIPFGTGGRRGAMYPIGTNAINDRTIGESAQGLADYVKENVAGPLSCAIAYDPRHRSRRFAELCAEIMVAAGFKVWFLDGYRSTPALSVAVRQKKCSCGIMVTASHNPPSDNAVKVYWSSGGQLLPPHDKAVIDRVMAVETIHRAPFQAALADGRVEYCQAEIDETYTSAAAAQSLGGPRDIKILYSPLHGVGASSVCPVLAKAGFKDVETYGPQAEPNGDFPNVPGHVSNPENPATFDALIEHAKQSGAELILSTDPDADRLGCAARLKKGGAWKPFTGNQIAALLAEHILAGRKAAGRHSREDYLVKTIVTTEMIRRIGDAYGVRTYGELMVGFKWIAGLMDDLGPERFVFGAEESHGYLVGQYARDKDAAVAALLMAELAAQCKARGQTLHEKLDALFWQYGCHQERTVSKTMPGSEGMGRMTALMNRLRKTPPTSLAGTAVSQTRDFDQQMVASPSADRHPLEALRVDMVMLDLAAAGNYAAVRPSGTEPKVKFYLFAYEPPEQLAHLDDAKAELSARLDRMERDLAAYADA